MLPSVSCPVPVTLTREYTLDEWNRALCKTTTTPEQCCQLIQTTMQNNCTRELSKAAPLQELDAYRALNTSVLTSYTPSGCSYDTGVYAGEESRFPKYTRKCKLPVCRDSFVLTSTMGPARSEQRMTSSGDRKTIYVEYEQPVKCTPSAAYVSDVCTKNVSKIVYASQPVREAALQECKTKAW